MDLAIEVADVTKKFRRSSEPSKTVKERLLTWRRSTVIEFDALHGIDLEVAQGETVGLLGHNGSGKSTLLKCIAGTIRPTSGSIRVRGQLAAMLELGAGFHPDLTGRENVYLNGSILGFSKAHVAEIFDEIVDFSELDDFIDTQVKYYSSGMYARLGFAVAVNLKPDVLLVDEVLAVGDEAFQRKCLERVRRFQTEGRSIVLVTHSPDMVVQLCDRALVLDHGRPIHVGDTTVAARVFRHALNAKPEESGTTAPTDAHVPGGSPMVIESCFARTADNAAVAPGDSVEIGLRYRTTAPIPAVRARLIITSHDGIQMLNASTWDLLGKDLADLDGEGTITYRIDSVPYLDGTYRIGFVLQDPAETTLYAENLDATNFDVYSGLPLFGRVKLDIGIDHQTGAAQETAPLHG